MSWIPPSLGMTCAIETTITTCQPPSLLFLRLVTILFSHSRDVDTIHNHPLYYYEEIDDSEAEHRPPEVFDFIVVGAGSAGCVVANRLSEVPNWRVLLLEAGGEEPEVAAVPGLTRMLQRSSVDWAYNLQPQATSCLARRNGQCVWSAGRVMGGSSTLNYMIYTRGNKKDYDEWAAMGNTGWSYADVLRYFIKSENNRNLERTDRFFHGVGGYLSVGTFPYQDAPTRAIIQAYHELGLPITDPNGHHQIGAYLLQHTTRDGERNSANAAFIRPIRKVRSNLVVRPNAYVTRLLIHPETKVVYGVEYMRTGKIIQVHASKEVIVTAGPIQTPRILMVSGIGPARHLQKFKIPCIKDLLVGHNLQDHVTFDGPLFALPNKTATSADFEQQRNDLLYYRETLRGPFSSSAVLQSNAFVQTRFEKDQGRPDIQISIDPASISDMVTDPVLAGETNIAPFPYYDGFIVRLVLIAPESRGMVQLNNVDPVYGAPLIYANSFSQKMDLIRVLAATKQSLSLGRTRAFHDIGAQLVTVPLPNCAHYKFGTDQYWTCIITSYTATIYHPCGTCKMGPKKDPTAVVDPELRVYGIKNLRLAGMSIAPRIPRGNTNAIAIMIGEKASDLIKDTWLKSEIPEINALNFDEETFNNLYFGEL